MDPRFHPAQAALAAGDLQSLAALFAADPDLATAVSSRSHPTLLQCLVLTMPPVDNLEALIAFLADHGAEVSGPLIAASGMNNVRAIAKLLDRGACIDGNGHWSPLGGASLLREPGFGLAAASARGSRVEPPHSRRTWRHEDSRVVLRRDGGLDPGGW